MSKLYCKINGLDFLNPFVIASGPPGTNKSTISKAFREGWGGVVAKTVSLDGGSITNLVPRYGKLLSRKSKEVIGFENIELISDRPIEHWIKDFTQIKKEFPEHILIASIMESYDENKWQKLVNMINETGVDGFELNFSCPHGLPERAMGMAMGENPEIVKTVTQWVRKATQKPVWAKMTPNLADISLPSLAAIEGGADGISLINTILSIIGVNLKTLHPMPTVKGYSLPGGYSSQAVRPIALHHLMRLNQAINNFKQVDLTNISISGMGGAECAQDALEFLLLGANSVQFCTAPMLHGLSIIHEIKKGTCDFMEQHGFNQINEFVGHSLQYFKSHTELAEIFKTKKQSSDNTWSGDQLTQQTKDLTSH